MTKSQINIMDEMAIIQQIVPKYRVGFFNELKTRMDFELYSSSKGIEKNISTTTENAKYKTNIIGNVNIMNRVIFQYLPFKKLFLKEVVLFEFNIRIISSMLLLLIRMVGNKKNILWTHGITNDMSAASKLIRLFFLKRATSIIVYENSARNALVKYCITEKNIFVAKNSIDIREMRKYFNTEQKKFRVTYIGRLTKEKNISLLCDAFLSVMDNIPSSIILTIIGDGEEVSKLRKKFESNRVEFLGQLNDEKQISIYMNQTYFTVSPDYLGLMIVHSFSYAIPILINKTPKTSHSPEIELFQENENGWCFNGTQSNLETKLVQCLKETSTLRESGINGLNKVKKDYGVEVMSESFLKAMKNCYD